MNASTTADGYQSPFQTPLFNLPTADMSSLLTIFFFIIFVIWAIYTAIAAYHWFRYSHRSWLAVPAVGIYIAFSLILIFYIASGV